VLGETHGRGDWVGVCLLVAVIVLMTSSPAIAAGSQRDGAIISAIPIVPVSDATARVVRGDDIAVAVSIRTAGIATVTARYEIAQSRTALYALPAQRRVGSELPPRVNEEVAPEVVHFVLKPNLQGRRALARRRRLRIKIVVNLRASTGVSSGAGTAITVTRATPRPPPR
jgi:hypothetical protein